MVTLDAFGMRVVFEFPLVPGLGTPVGADASSADLRARLATREAIAGGWHGPASPPRTARRFVDGLTLLVERSADDAVRWTWADRGEWLLDPLGSELRAWAPDATPDPSWQRVLLDSVLASVALRRGAEALHAAAAIDESGDGLAIVAGTGGGKTSLLAELLRRGWALLADDVVVFPEGTGMAWPAPPVLNLPHTVAVESVGTKLADIGDEHWVLAANPATAPAALRTIVILERRADVQQLALERASGLALLAHVLESGADPHRQEARFRLPADLAEEAAVLVCLAPLSTTPAELADAVTSQGAP
jgi:hypothetical protein